MKTGWKGEKERHREERVELYRVIRIGGERFEMREHNGKDWNRIVITYVG